MVSVGVGRMVVVVFVGVAAKRWASAYRVELSAWVTVRMANGKRVP